MASTYDVVKTFAEQVTLCNVAWAGNVPAKMISAGNSFVAFKNSDKLRIIFI